MQTEKLFEYFPTLTDKQRAQFLQIPALYASLNEKINLISRKDTEHLQERHVLHSLAVAKFCSFAPGTRILDIGTGGGFPGIPLAVLLPEVTFHLVDSIGKKIRAVQEVIETLKLKNVTAEQQRAEELTGRYDFMVSRAVTRASVLYRWGRKLVVKGTKNSLPNGIICLKGGDLTEELAEIRTPYKIFEIKEVFQEDFFDTKKIVYIPVV